VARTLSARYYKDGSEILIKQEGKNPRRLTPRECARLMGFDKAGQPRFVIPVSDTQSYKQFGNSVAVPVVEAVASHMLPYIFKAMRSTKDTNQAEMLFE
ncbi:TPA: DNA cytosine methyltransferase, partial [Streptococcus pyogenes]|nr:DNA cytosine methyltransferase [Streptococcus pyogenes]